MPDILHFPTVFHYEAYHALIETQQYEYVNLYWIPRENVAYHAYTSYIKYNWQNICPSVRFSHCKPFITFPLEVFASPAQYSGT